MNDTNDVLNQICQEYAQTFSAVYNELPHETMKNVEYLYEGQETISNFLKQRWRA